MFNVNEPLVNLSKTFFFYKRGVNMKSICNFVFNFIETSIKRFNIVECLSIISTTFVQYLDKLEVLHFKHSAEVEFVHF